MNGYYEWQKTPTGKQPHYIHADTELLTAAGLYAGTKNDATGEWDHTFTIITREAKDASGDIHDRMPVFLTPDIWDTWLQPAEIDYKEDMVDLLERVSSNIASTVTTYPVSRRVNNAHGDNWNDPTLIEPIPDED